LAGQLAKDYPELKAVNHNAGSTRLDNLKNGGTERERGKRSRSIPLDQFITETMNILKNSPEATEICVERVKALRFAESSGSYDAFFKNFNDRVSAAAH